MFWLVLAWVGLAVAQYLLRPRQKSSAVAPGEFAPPDVPAGTPMPVAFGTVKLDPIITTFSYTLRPFYVDSVQVGWVRVVTYDGMLTWGPIHEYVDIIFDETKKLTAQGSQVAVNEIDTSTFPPVVTTSTIAAGIAYGGFGAARAYAEIFLPGLFGGIDNGGEGGIQHYYNPFDPQTEPCVGRQIIGGSYNFFPGDSRNQDPIDDVRYFGGPPKDGSCVDSPTTSGTGRIRYPRFGHVYLKDVGMGSSQQLKREQFVVRCDAGDQLLGTGAAPGRLLLRILTDTEWGLGISQALLDASAIVALGSDFTDGISGALLEQKPAEEYINEILRTVDAVLYRHPATGLLSGQNIRGGYTVGALPVLNESNVTECEWTRRDLADTVNEITVAFTDAARLWNRNVVTVQDHANIHMTGGVRSQTIEYPWITSEEWALIVAARDLKANTLPLGRGSVVVSRDAFDAVPGDLFALSWARYGISEMPVRVLSVSVGDVKDGSVILELVEDLYGFPDVPYTATSDPWTDPAALPSVVPSVHVARDSDETAARIALTMLTGADLVTLVEFSTRSGNALPTAYAAGTGSDPQYFSPDVALSVGYESEIFWRVTYTDPSGVDATLTGSEVFQATPTATTGAPDPVIVDHVSGPTFVFAKSTGQQVFIKP